jgi:phage terminase small subunit
MAKITIKQKKFCDEYLKDCNISRACKKSNYSRKYGYLLLEKLHIQEYLAKKIKKASKSNDLKLEDILADIKSIVDDDIGNYVDFRTELTQVGTSEEGVPILAYAPVMDLKDSTTINTKNVQEVQITRNGAKIKLYSREKALSRLLDYLEKTNPEGDDGNWTKQPTIYGLDKDSI